ncbi:MAG: GNAT family N-acetyltransferase [Pseudomonadota bacterium]
MGTIIDLDIQDESVVSALAGLTYAAFEENSPEWIETLDEARQVVMEVGDERRFGRVWMADGEPLGWVGVIKRKYLWELHPIAVAVEHQFSGIGHGLVEDVARLAKNAGALTLFAGASDETGTTNLFGVDIYENPIESMKILQSAGRSAHQFWISAGFTVVGLMPDEEGCGKPGIHLARRV